MQGLISVIIPTYNRKDLILRSVNSVLEQTYKEIEVIVVDDASDDGTIEIFKNHEDPRVHFYHYDKNMGACYARNYGVNKAKGEYIAFQDSDDIWDPKKLEKQLSYLLKSDADLVFCGLIRKMDEKKFYVPLDDFNENGDIIEQLLIRNSISTQTMLMKNKIFEEVHFDESLARYQDWDFSLQVALAGYKIAYLPEALVECEVSEDCITKRIDTVLIRESFLDKYYEQYRKYPHALAKYYYYCAHECKQKDNKKSQNFLTKSLKTEFSFRTLLIIILNKLGLWKNVRLEKIYNKITNQRTINQ